MSTKQLPAQTNAAAAAPEALDKWRQLGWLPCDLSPQVPVSRFTVRELLRLRPGAVISSGWSRSTEIPLYANGERIGWTELDSVGEHIGARVTELV